MKSVGALLRVKQVNIVLRDGSETLADHGREVATTVQPTKQKKQVFLLPPPPIPSHIPIQLCPITDNPPPTPPKQKEKEPAITPRPLPQPKQSQNTTTVHQSPPLQDHHRGRKPTINCECTKKEEERILSEKQKQPKPLEILSPPQHHQDAYPKQSWGSRMPPPPNQNTTISQQKKGVGVGRGHH
eukprot:9609685-Ditylum_brightwellii.AAC.1